MEAFEQVVKVYLEAKGHIVTSGVKFPVRKQFRNRSGKEQPQTHGYEVDLVAANRKSLLLGSVKSYFGSAGVRRQGFVGIADTSKRTHFRPYTMFNDAGVRNGILAEARHRYRYPLSRIRMALFVGKFHRPDEQLVRQHLSQIRIAGGPIEVVGLEEIVATLLEVSRRKTYINDAVIMTLKVLDTAGLIHERASVPQSLGTELDEFEEEDETE